MAEIEKRSNGRIKFEPYYNQTLLTLRATHQGLKTGVADMAYHWHAAEPAKLPLSQFSLYLGTMMNTWAGVKAWEEFVELPAIKAEWEKEGMKPLWGFGAPIYSWIGNKPVEKWEDLKGQRVYGGAPIPEIMAKVGITAVDLPAAELYEALLRGTLDSLFYPMASVPLWKFQEVAKYYNLDFPGVGGKMYGYVITLDVWNKLPADLQQIMLLKDFDVAGTVYKLYDLAESKKGVDAVKAKGLKELHSTPETIKALDELAVKPIRDAYAAELDKKGLPGTAMLKAWMDLNKKYEALFPAEAKKQGWQ
ncbi:MAG: TRAP transporter substrate-binding protein DctP [Chloroflexi bacterium]|nr:TRAP transporter substrate-binding protein DctP [Chloroflexota bacterium]